MSDSVQEINHLEQAAASSVGAILSAARQAAGLSVEEAASQLRLGPRQIQALEADDTQSLPAPTFVRGFIRNYAKLLKLDPDELLELYRVHTPASEQRQISLHSENIPIVGRDKKTWQPYILASAVIGLVLAGWLVYMEYLNGDRGAAVPDQVTSAVAVAPPAPAVPAEPTGQTASTPVPPQTLPEPAIPSVQTVEPQVPPATPGPAKLALTVKEQSWVSVKDGEGKEILNKTFPAGHDEFIEGVPPLHVVIGNAAGVQVSYKDKPVDLAPHTGSNVARFTLE